MEKKNNIVSFIRICIKSFNILKIKEIYKSYLEDGHQLYCSFTGGSSHNFNLFFETEVKHHLHKSAKELLKARKVKFIEGSVHPEQQMFLNDNINT